MKTSSHKSKLIAFSFALILGILGFWALGRSFIQDHAIALTAVEIDPFQIRPLGNADDEPCDWLRPNRKLDAVEAVRLAECFIEVNGYTDKPPVDRTKLTPENVYPGTDDFGLKMRHNSLEGNAYGYWDTELYGGGWEIAFRRVRHVETVKFYGPRLETIARCVWMDYYGRDMIVGHTDCFLSLPGLQRISDNQEALAR